MQLTETSNIKVELNFTEIKVFGIFPSDFLKADTKNPHYLFQDYAYKLNTINIFKGVVEFDESFNTHIIIQIIKLITKALYLAEKTVFDELQWREDIAKSNKSNNTRVTTGSNNIIIDRL